MTRWRRLAIALAASALALAVAPAARQSQSWKELALASFDDAWKTINDTFYDPSFGGLDWPAVSKELRPRVEAAASPDEARAIIREMLSRLHRSHFGLLSRASKEALSGPAMVPVEFRVTADGAVVTRVTNDAGTAAGLKPGQILVYVDDRPVAELLRNEDQLEPKAAMLESWQRVNRVLHGFPGVHARLIVRDVSGVERTITVARSIDEGEMAPMGNLPPFLLHFEARDLTTPAKKRAGYIAFNVWLGALNDRIADSVDRFRQHDGIVIDLRGNPGGLAAMMSGVAGHFIAEPVLLGTMRTRFAPLQFKVNPRLATADGRKVDVFRGPLAILVDELTGSTSETFVGSLQGLGRVRVFGVTTMGQALPALTKQLPSGDVLIHAIGDFTTAAGRSLEGAGVTPDVVVSLSPKALAAGRDDVLEAALRWVDATAKNP